jgi:hypothetical protein
MRRAEYSPDAAASPQDQTAACGLQRIAGTWVSRGRRIVCINHREEIMKNAPARDLEWNARLSARWVMVTALALGALLTCFPTQIRAAEPFGRGNLTGSIYVGASRALDIHQAST